jgi:hypothetical protein
MLIHYTLQKITMGHKKWATIACVHPIFKKIEIHLQFILLLKNKHYNV